MFHTRYFVTQDPKFPVRCETRIWSNPIGTFTRTLTFSNDVFKLLLQLSILIAEVADNGLLEGTLNNISCIYIES